MDSIQNIFEDIRIWVQARLWRFQRVVKLLYVLATAILLWRLLVVLLSLAFEFMAA